MSSRETKTLHFQVKATGIATNDAGQEVGQIEAYGAVFNNIDEGNDRILPGSFKRTIKNSKERAQTRKKNYFISMLWNHDTDHFMPIGGWHDVKEDDFGLLCKGDVLLATQTGHDYYELAKAGMVDEFSIIYDVPQGGAKYDKSGVRELNEIRLFSIDPVVFAMNDATYMVGIKSVTGSTSLPIGPRDEAWDGSKAKKQIFDYAKKDDDTFNVSKLKKCFLRQDGDPQLKGSWSYPFCYIKDGSPTICVGGVKACAGALSGARNADAGSDTAGMKSKIATLYKKINSKYPDAETLTPPWEDDGKRSHRPMEKKTLLEHYHEEMAQDLLEDWQDVYVCTLTKAVLDALKIGDQPTQDISEALDAFKELVMSKFVAQAVEVGLSDYLEENEISYSSADSTMHNGSSSYYGYMSRGTPLQGKAGRAISQANADTIQGHIDSLHDEADSHLKAAKAHAKAIHSVADDLATVLQGSEAAYGTDHGTPEDNEQEGKRASYTGTRAHQKSSSQSGDTVSDDELSSGLNALKSLTSSNLA